MKEAPPQIADPALRYLIEQVGRHLIAVGKLMMRMCGAGEEARP